MAEERQSPFPQSGAIADRIAQQLARVGKTSQIGVQTIAPGETWTFKCTGSFFYVVDATTGFKARLDGQPYVDVRAGSSLKTAQGAFFEWVELLNNTATALTVKVYGGFAEYRDERLFTLEPLTDPLGHNVEEIDAGATYIVPNSTEPNVIRRKHLLVCNRHATDHLVVLDSRDYPLGCVEAGGHGRFETAGTLKVRVPGENPIPVVIGEIYWVFYPFPVVPGELQVLVASDPVGEVHYFYAPHTISHLFQLRNVGGGPLNITAILVQDESTEGTFILSPGDGGAPITLNPGDDDHEFTIGYIGGDFSFDNANLIIVSDDPESPRIISLQTQPLD